MAWLSGGETNSELVDNLVGNGLISLSTVERAFRSVDRKLFVPEGNEDVAYSDQPLKEGNIHISAPHIYCTALENLDLEPNSSMTFLNVGSGTGYLSCLVAEILGPKSMHVGVEIHQDALEHCRKSIEKWQIRNQEKACGKRRAESSTANSTNDLRSTPSSIDKNTLDMSYVHGNGLEISPNSGESSTGFDRIYIGAAIDSSELPNIQSLLRPGGVLVGPVDDDMVKIVRIGPRSNNNNNGSVTSNIISIDDSNHIHDLEFTTQIISNVRFAPLLQEPKIQTVIPARVWGPSSNHLYPDNFQKSVRSLLLCSNSTYVQPKPQPKEQINLAATLPRDVWMHIISFTNRKWFEPENTHVDFLQKRIVEEQKIAMSAQKALLQARARCMTLEHELDMYRHLARRLQARLQKVTRQQELNSENSSSDDIIMDDAEGSAIDSEDIVVRPQIRTVSISSHDMGMESNEDL